MFQSNEKLFSLMTYITGLFTILSIGLVFGGIIPASYFLISLFVYFCTGCLGITVMFHRYLSHRSFKTYKPFVYLFSLFGALGATGSPLGWVAVHRTHHRYTDTPMDPHSPVTGSVFGIFTNNYNFTFNKWIVKDLLRDKFQLFIHRYYGVILLAWMLFWVIIGWQWFLFVCMVPMFLQLIISAASVYLAHTHGYKNFELPLPDNSRNNWFNSLIAWGEGWHNNHHAAPHKWNFKVKWWEFDIGAMVIRCIKK